MRIFPALNITNCIKCTECGKLFTQSSSLKIHQRYHGNEKPFHCTKCPGAFKVKGELTKHQRIHTGSKPYSCKKCKQSFTWPYALKHHSKIHLTEIVSQSGLEAIDLMKTTIIHEFMACILFLIFLICLYICA